MIRKFLFPLLFLANLASFISIPCIAIDILLCSTRAQKMKCMVKPGEELMPHRSSNCGGECKNTEAHSAHDGSKLGSDSEHLVEDELAEEDLIEFTNDEAMKKNLVNWCPGDCTLKKRKRQHVARRLFSAND